MRPTLPNHGNWLYTVVLTVFTTSAYAQWQEKNNGLDYTQDVHAIAVSGDILFASLLASVYVSEDGGDNWEMRAGFTLAQSLAFKGNLLFAGTRDDGIFVTDDNGVTWTHPLQGYYTEVEGVTTTMVSAIAVSGDDIFAATGGGVIRSGDDGLTWTNTHLPSVNTSGLAVIGTNVFASTYEGVFISVDNGDNWSAVNSGLSSRRVSTLFANGPVLYAGTDDGFIFRSTNNGGDWTQVTSTNEYVRSFAAIGTNIFAGLLNGVVRSADNGLHWTTIDPGAGNINNINNGVTLAADGQNLFAGTASGISLSMDHAAHWKNVNDGLPVWHSDVSSILPVGAKILAGTSRGVYASSDNGDTWFQSSAGLTHQGITTLITHQDKVYAATDGGVFVSSDNGSHWEEVNNGITIPNASKLFSDGTALYLVSWVLQTELSSGVFISINDGASWSALNINSIPLSAGHDIMDFTVLGSHFFVVVYDEANDPAKTTLFHSADRGATWQEIHTIRKGVSSIDGFGNKLLALMGNPQSLYMSDDYGATWRNLIVEAYDFADGSVMLRDQNAGQTQDLISFDAGATWLTTSLYGLTGATITKINDRLFAGGNGIGIYSSPTGSPGAIKVRSIDSVTPLAGPAGTMVTVTGKGLSDVSTVAFYLLMPDRDHLTTSAVITSQSDTELTFAVPSDAGAGPVLVLWTSPYLVQSGQSAMDFRVGEVDEDLINEGIEAGPNPAEGIISVDLKDLSPDPVTIVLQNIAGQVISSGEATGMGIVSLDLSGLGPGMYLVTVLQGGSTHRAKIVKK